MRELGMIAVLPAFQGNVPGEFRELFPSANISTTGTAWIDAFDPLFSRVQKAVMEELIQSFGTDHWYAADGYFDQNSPPWLAQADGDHNRDKSPVVASPPHTSADSGVFKYPDVPADSEARSRASVVYKSLTAVDPDAVWLFQGWVWRGYSDNAKQLSYVKGWVEGVPNNKFIVLNMWDEVSPDWKVHSYFGAPFIWSVLHNFGGNTGLWGSLQTVFDGPAQAVDANSSVVGTGAAPEGIDQNPVYYNLVMDVNWQRPTDEASGMSTSAMIDKSSSSKLEDYVLNKYVPQRYGWWGAMTHQASSVSRGIVGGGSLSRTQVSNTNNNHDDDGVVRLGGASSSISLDSDWGGNRHKSDTNVSQAIAEAQVAWTALFATVYNDDNNQALIKRITGFLAEKNCDGLTGLPFSGTMATPPTSDWYDLSVLVRGWGALIRAGSVAPRPLARPFVYDLVNVGREALAKLSNRSYKKLMDAATTDDLQAAATKHFDLMRDADELLCSESSFSTATWLAQARALSKPEHGLSAEYLETNARAQTTTWGPQKEGAKMGSINRDYANKQWGGQVLGFYSARLQCYVTQKLKDLKAGHKDVDRAAFELCAGKVSYEWTHDFGAKQFPLCAHHAAERDVIQLSRALFDKYHLDMV
jgi:alpha-N-acetylglucosaminidase